MSLPSRVVDDASEKSDTSIAMLYGAVCADGRNDLQHDEGRASAVACRSSGSEDIEAGRLEDEKKKNAQAQLPVPGMKRALSV